MRLSTRTPARTGISAAAIWPISFGSAGRPRTSSTTPTAAIATRAEQDRAALAVAGQPDPAGDLDRDEDRQAGEARHRPVVQAALLRVVDRARPGRRAARRRAPAARRSPRRRRRRGRRRWSSRPLRFALRRDGPDQATRGSATAPSAPSTRSAGSRRCRTPTGVSRLRRRSAAGSSSTCSRPVGDQRLVDAAHAAGEGGEDGGAEGDGLAVHRPPRADHEVGVGDQALGVDRPLGDDQVGGAERPRRRALLLGAGDDHRLRLGVGRRGGGSSPP